MRAEMMNSSNVKPQLLRGLQLTDHELQGLRFGKEDDWFTRWHACELLTERGVEPLPVASGFPKYGGVYVVTYDDRRFKIGRAVSFARRLSDIQMCSPDELRLVSVLSLNPDAEGAWHDRYPEHRVRGEWFELPPAIVTFLRHFDLRHTEVA